MIHTIGVETRSSDDSMRRRVNAHCVVNQKPPNGRLFFG